MPKKKKTEVNVDAVPTPLVTTAVLEEQSAEPIKYVVLRGGYRVSETEYNNAIDPAAISERDYWSKISKASNDGQKVEIVKLNKREHRVW